MNLEAGIYETDRGEYTLPVDSTPVYSNENDDFFVMVNEEGVEAIVPFSQLHEEMGGEGYSTGYSSASNSGYSGTDSTGGRGKKLLKKKKKKKPLKKYKE